MLFSIDACLIPVSLFKLGGERKAVHETSSLKLLVVNKMLIEDGEFKWSQGMRVYVCSCMDMFGGVHACVCVFMRGYVWGCTCSSVSVVKKQPQVLYLETFPFLFETGSLLSLKCRPEDWICWPFSSGSPAVETFHH